MTQFKDHEQDETDNEYATPPEIWRPISRAVNGFNLDPCSGAESNPIAEKRYTKEDDGLLQEWVGDTFVNPPWASNGDGSAKHDWLMKAKNEAQRSSVNTVTVLLPADTSSHWFHDHILDANLVCLVGPGRIPFEGEDRNPSFEMIIAVYGNINEDLIQALNDLGAVIRGREIVEPTEQISLTESLNAEHHV